MKLKLARKATKQDLINIAVILVLLGAFVWLGMEYTGRFGTLKGDSMLSTAQNLKQLILSYGKSGIVVTFFLQILQVIVSFIPGNIVQFVIGMIYGTAGGIIIGVVGVAAGTTISFFLSRLLGRRVVSLFVSEKALSKVEGWISGDLSVVALLVLFMIPGFPKDFIAYFIGLTTMNASKFLLISMVGRLPGMFVSIYLGAHLFDRNYALIVAVASGCCVLFLLLYIFRNRILRVLANKKQP